MDTRKLLEKYSKDYGTNTYSLQNHIAQVKIWCYTMNNWNDKELQALVAWEGTKDTSYYDDSGYLKILSSYYEKASGGWDNGSSSGMHELYGFTKWAIEEIAKVKLAALSQEKRAKLASLESEKARIEKELEEINK